MFRTAYHLRFETGPGRHFIRIEHPQLETSFKDITEGVVNVGFADEAVFETVFQGAEGPAALQIGSVEDSVH